MFIIQIKLELTTFPLQIWETDMKKMHLEYYRDFFSKLSDDFQQVLCDTKALNESIPWITFIPTLDRKKIRK